MDAASRPGSGDATETDGPISGGSRAYWRANLRVMAILLSIWFVASYGLGILFVESLNRFTLGGFPLGFWFAQQGSIYVFVLLILVYAFWMDRIDARYGVDRA